MKPLPTLLLLCLLGGLIPASAQLMLPNPSFENWEAFTGYEEFNGYQTSNAFSQLIYESTQVSSVPSPGGTAVRLEVGVTADLDTLNSFIRAGQSCDGQFGGGIPFVERPDSVVMWIRHNIPAGDHANLVLLYSLNDVVEDFSYCAFTGDQPDFYRFACAITPPAAGSYNQLALEIKPGSWVQAIPGAWLEVDSIALIGSTVQFPNSGFEDVDTLRWDNPDGWASPNALLNYIAGISAITQSPDAYSGNNSLKLETVSFSVNCDQDTFAFLVEGVWDGLEEPLTGLAFTPESNQVCFGGYYRYEAVGNDTALAGILLTRYNPGTGEQDELEHIGIALPPAATFTQFEFCMDTSDWTVQPDSFHIIFQSSDGDQSFSEAELGVGSALWLDDLYFSRYSTGVSLELIKGFSLFPNPSRDQFVVEWDNPNREAYRISLFDLSGKQLQDWETSSSQHQMSVAALPPGLYLLSMESVSGKERIQRKVVKR